jgi:hypothetical protein
MLGASVMMRNEQRPPRGVKDLACHLTLVSCGNQRNKRSMKCSMKASKDNKKTPETKQCQG